MKDKDYLGKVIKYAINDSIFDIKASRDIFNEAWNNKEKEMRKRKYFSIKNTRKEVLVPVCCVLFAIVGVFTFSPGARAAAQEALKTIFLPDNSGNIVEKSEDTEVPVVEGPVFITNDNREAMERRLGFKVNLPEKIGEYTYDKVDDYVFSPMVTIMAKDVKYKDAKEIQEKLKRSIDDDKAFEELEKDYKLSRIVSASYEDDKGHKFQVIPIKREPKRTDAKVITEVNIDGINCMVTQDVKFNYGEKENGETDLEHKPISSEENYWMDWNYDGIDYGLAIGNDAPNIDAAIDFAREYIKVLKQK
ncbi:hypothetical protein [Clostridium chromiireducens]|uniref:DUF4367 domain-containing protein n=1 Tax=Clostridium chromiireducens TaxID=225345 RepID=A0A1V4ITZ7_9CLOT|nr:hypothetical protein [Clostridium chromiireducens]OPJ63518.1 hypothetical protein CLCHR_16160 [Clostridium chromiireducens]